jgi:hypothetical protein
MKSGLAIKLLVPMLALVFAGCVSVPSSPDSSASHPANSQASESPEAPPTPMLMVGSQGLVLPLSTNGTGMPHGEHHQKPAGKGAEQPAQHKHDHEQPKKQEEKK